MSNNRPRRQLGVCPTTGLDDSLVWKGHPPSTTVWYETGIPSRRQLGVYQQQASTIASCVFNNRPRRQLGVYLTTGLDGILSLMMPLNVNVPYACLCLPKVTALIGNLYRKPSSEYPLLVQGRRVDPSWIFLARSRVTVMQGPNMIDLSI